MSRFQQFMRPARILLAGLILLTACSRPPAIYSRNPVDESGTPFQELALVGLELRDHTRYELEDGESLYIESGVLVVRSQVRADGSRRQRAFDLDEVVLLKVRHSDGNATWYPVATPADLTEFTPLPRLNQITMVDGETFDFSEGLEARWSASHLEILVGPRGAEDADLRILPLNEIESVQIADTNTLKATLLSPKFWIVAGAAAALAWFLAGRENSDNTAVE